MSKASAAPEPGKKLKLSKSIVDSIAAPGIYPDDDITGFRLWVGKSGVKSYQLVGKVKGESRPVYYTIGKHGSPWTPDAARKEAGKMRLLMLQGVNPNTQNKEKKSQDDLARVKSEDQQKARELTLQKVFNDYIKDMTARKKIKASTVDVYGHAVNKCLADWLGKPIASILSEDVEDRHTQISQLHPGQANHVMRVLRALFNFAMNKYKTQDRQLIIKENPVSHLSKSKRWNPLNERSNIVKDHQLKALFEACRWLEHPTASDYVPFLLLTGLRSNEAASLPWSHVDFKGRQILITNTKNGKDHRLPLTDFLYALLKNRWQSRTGDYVFSLDGVNYMGDYRFQLERLITRTRYLLGTSEDEDIRMGAESFNFMLHDLRRTFGTAAALTQPGYVVKGLMNHSDKSDVTQTHYIHADVEKLRKPMKEIGDHLLRCAGVSEYKATSATSSDKIVQLTNRLRKKVSS